ncbi:MAG TPA: diguanylate cyclase, partial [Acidimicrobiales bacterium]|nr:diguanylate cyclase [Acidimicrobiales bacterium]
YPFDGTIGLEVLDDLYAAAPGVPCVMITDHPGDVRGDPRAARPWALLPRTDLAPDVLLESIAAAIVQAGERRPAAASRQQRAILDGFDDGVMLVSTTGRIISRNEMASMIFGLSTGGRDVRTVWDLPGAFADRPDSSRRDHPLSRAVERNARISAVREIVRPIDRVRRWIEFVAQPLVADGESLPYAVVLTIRDVTAQHAEQRARRQVEHRELALTEHATDGYVVLDADGRILDASPTVLRGRRFGSVIGSRAIELLEPSARRAFTEALLVCRGRPRRPEHVRVGWVDGDGGCRIVDATLTDWTAETSIEGIVVNLRDVTDFATIEERDQSEEKDQSVIDRCDFAFEQASSGMAVLDLSFRVVRANGSLLELLGRHADDVVGSDLASVVHRADRDAYRSELESVADGRIGESRSSYRLLGVNDQFVWVDLDVVMVPDAGSEPRHLFVQMHETTGRRRSEVALAIFDTLTGLPNRRLLHDRLTRAIEQIVTSEGGVAVVRLDIDRFQGVNDTLGYDTGDELLTQVVGRIASGLARSDTFARIRGDAFVIVREQCDEVAAAALGQQLVRRFDEAFLVSGQEILLTASTGVVLVDELGSVADALRDADAAARIARARGGDRSEVFVAELRHQAEHRFGLEQTLSRAIENDDLRVVYQPIIDIATGSLVGFEALLRWYSPVWGEVPSMNI